VFFFSFKYIQHINLQNQPYIHWNIYTQEMGEKKNPTVNAQQARTVYNFKDIRTDYSSGCQVGFIS